MRRALALAGLAASLLSPPARAELPAPVEPRLYSTAGRVSVSASAGVSLFDTLTRTGTLQLGLGYDLKDWLGFDLRVGGALSGHTALADRIAQHLLQQPPSGTVDDLSDLWQLRALALAGVRLSPLYGKFNLGADLPVRYQISVWLGGGVGWLHRSSIVVCNEVGAREAGTCNAWLTENRAAAVASAGLGLRVFTGVHGAVSIELRSIVWKDRYLVGVDRSVSEAGRPSGTLAPSPGFTNALFVDVGYVFFF